eukprot:41572-Chlamydomonas_euryale.AAC.6
MQHAQLACSMRARVSSPVTPAETCNNTAHVSATVQTNIQQSQSASRDIVREGRNNRCNSKSDRNASSFLARTTPSPVTLAATREEHLLLKQTAPQ